MPDAIYADMQRHATKLGHDVNSRTDKCRRCDAHLPTILNTETECYARGNVIAFPSGTIHRDADTSLAPCDTPF